MINPTITETLERLVSGQVLCNTSAKACCDLMEDSYQRGLVNDSLALFGREMVKTSDGLGIYAAYRDISGPGVRMKVQSKFEKVATDWEALCYWLKLTKKLKGNNCPLQAGDILNISTLLENIENSVSSQNEIDKIAKRFSKVSVKKDTKSKLEAIINYLKNNGFLVSKGTTGSVYQATARWSLLFDQMEYIQREENIFDEEVIEAPVVEEEQRELF